MMMTMKEDKVCHLRTPDADMMKMMTTVMEMMTTMLKTRCAPRALNFHPDYCFLAYHRPDADLMTKMMKTC